MFDAISYSKGASVLRMLSRMLGEDVFLRGVSIYLKKHLYANAVTKDLWDGISEASGQDVAKIMSNWVLKQGFPVVSVEEKEDSIVVRQNRFLSTGDPTKEEDATLWHVPLALKTVGEKGAETDFGTVLAEEREKEIALPGAKEKLWKLNAETIGVYRVLYTAEHLQKLGRAAARDHDAFSIEDRVGLLGDALTLSQAGYASTSSWLDLCEALQHVESYLVMNTSAAGFAELADVWWEQPEDVREGIRKLRADLYGPAAQRLSLKYSDDDSLETRELRTAVVRAAAAADDPWTLAKIRKQFRKARKYGPGSIQADLLPIVLPHGVRTGGEAEYATALEIYRNAATPDQRISSMMALCSARDGDLVEQTLDMITNGEAKSQDFISCVIARVGNTDIRFFAGLARNAAAKRRLWDFWEANYDFLTEASQSNFVLPRVVLSVIGTFTSSDDAARIQRFFDAHDTAKFSMSVEQGLEMIHARQAWLTRDAPQVTDWLRARQYLS